MVGLPALLGAAVSSQRALCQAPAKAYTLPIGAFQYEIEKDTALATLLLRYAQAYVSQMA